MVPTSRMPSHREEGRKIVNLRATKLIREHGGKIYKFRDLPREAQLALVQYMAVDGEAWELAPGLEDACGEKGKGWHKILARFLPFYVKGYGKVEFGYIASIPVKVLIASILEDADAGDWKAKGWQALQDWYMGHGVKHTAPSRKPWPVILSSFDDETLEDGWTRFHQYAEKGLEACPALWYPSRKMPG